MSFFGVLVNPWAPMRSDAAFCSLGRATINLLARRQPPFHSRDGRANQPHAARCEGSRPAPGSVCRLLSRTRHRLPCSVPGGLLVQTWPYPAGSAATQFGMSAEGSRARADRSFPEADVAMSAVADPDLMSLGRFDGLLWVGTTRWRIGTVGHKATSRDAMALFSKVATRFQQ